MKDYNNLVDALQDLSSRGFTNDFNLKSNCLECKKLELEIHPEDFEITEMYRFEGDSSNFNDVRTSQTLRKTM